LQLPDVQSAGLRHVQLQAAKNTVHFAAVDADGVPPPAAKAPTTKPIIDFEQVAEQIIPKQQVRCRRFAVVLPLQQPRVQSA
jgi:hypothetical protein